ncbi:MAG: ATP synthase subunit J [Peptococcaceae bacterium BICA1-8]|nr:MAG: ATP synthase subunit J [Peptococcaceae bacterium BICA1-8]
MNQIILNKKTPPDRYKEKRSFLTPARVLVIGFLVISLVGTLLLMLSTSTITGNGLSFIDALFTSTSALCVTGLVVVDTGTTFTLFGQIVILLLIQIGGLGFMTFATLFSILLGKKITLKERLLLQEALNQVTLEGIVRLTKYVISISFIVEAIGALILSIRWSFDMGWSKALYFGIFHSVSAFNNAGFDLFGNFSSITSYQKDLVTNSTMMILIILGGFGFVVLSDFYTNYNRKKSLHTKIVVQTSLLFIMIGAILIFLLEFSNPQTLGALDTGGKALTSIFQSVTPRTAGFNTVDISQLRDTTQLLIIVLMFIGASPGSTGGGIKTTTILTIALSVINTFKGCNNVTYKERTIPKDIIHRAIAITSLAVLLILITTSILTITEKADFMPLFFESVSAFGTVGLSMGVTTQLSQMGKIAIIITMFCGRLGPLTVAFALGQNYKKNYLRQIKYPDERIIIG